MKLSITLAALSALATNLPALASPTTARSAQRVAAEDEELPALEIPALSFADAKSRAERLEKMLVVVWSRDGDAKNAQFEKALFGDPEVRTWLDENAVIARVDVDAHKQDAARNRIGPLQTPSVDIFSIIRGGRIDRLVFGTTSMDFLAAVLGQTGGERMERPKGKDANEPFRWLAYANQCFNTPGLEAGFEAVWAYEWCLNTADGLRPGFRARYFEFLVRRMLQCRPRSSEAEPKVHKELMRIAQRHFKGEATPRDSYEYGRLVEWLRADDEIREHMAKLHEMGAERRPEQLAILHAAAPVLGRHEEFAPLLSAVGEDAVPIYVARAIQLAPMKKDRAKELSTEEGEGQGAKKEEMSPEIAKFYREPLPFTTPLTRGALLDEASWIYEGLVSADRVEEARALQQALAARFPSAPRAYVPFMERALRQGRHDLVAELGDIALANLEKRSAKRIERVLDKIPLDEGK